MFDCRDEELHLGMFDRSMFDCGDEELHLGLTVSSKNKNDQMIQDVVLQSLQPHGNLTDLAILNYGGRIFPPWLLNPLLPKLTTLTLNFCIEPNFLPPFGRLPYLRFLKLSGSTGFRDVSDELNAYSLLAEYGTSKQPKKPSYPSLEVLSLRNMLNLVEWQGHDGDFPYLKELVIENCPKLWKIATVPQEATFEYCPKLKSLTCPTVIKKLKIHECGFREIMFGSISENLTISKCLELTSINWSDGGINFVEEVTFECCPKLKLQSIPTKTKTLKIAYCDFQEIVIQLVSENLTISNCVELISITFSDGGLNFVKEVTFKCCPKLELVTIPIGILKLEIHECGLHEIFFQSVPKNLTISNCIELTSINWMDRGVNSVREVIFEYCPKLELVTIPFETWALIINKCGFREIILQSVPQYLTISNCRKLTSINWSDGGINSIEEVTFECCPKLKLVIIPIGILKLDIHECGLHEIFFQSVPKNLTISNCIELTSINWMDRGINSIEEVTFECCPKLKLVTIPIGILKLEIHECGLHEIFFQSVPKNLTISNCIELTSINWMDRGINSIEKVTFECCPKLKLVTIPIGILKLEIHECGLHEIFFQSVPKNLTISNCIELTSINWIDREVNSIREIIVEYCPKLELMTIPFETWALTINKCGFREIILQSVPQYLTISNCIELISIKWMDGGFNSVILVTFEYCPKLELITIPVETLTLIINDCGFREITFQSVSDNLTISNCVELISINWMSRGLNSVGVVSFKHCPKLKLITIPVGTSKLKINECGFREIVFSSVSENLTISNCVELISINWMDRALNSVRKVSFEYCPKLELVTIPVGALNLKIHECGFREIMFQSVSENLTISNCLELTSINWMDRGVNSIREVSFEYCPKLEFVTILVRTLKLKIYKCGFHEIMFQSVSKNLTISNCLKLISINWMDRGLNSVRKVSFQYCPKLKLITIPVGTLKLGIANCVELTSINWRDGRLNSIREVSLKYCPKLELQLHVKNALHSMTQGVEIYDCPRLDLCNYVYKRDSRMTKLKLFGNNEIRLSCASVNSAIPLLEKPFTLFLTKEDFLGVESLTCAPSDGVSCHHVMLNLASLVVLEILKCRKVISMTGLDNLSNLKRLSISYCPELCNWEDKTLPQSLEFLKLDSCDKLSSLPLLSVENNSNTLNFLSIIKCPRLAVLEGFHGLMNLKTVELIHCGNLSISPATANLQLRPRITIGNCTLMRDWCQRNSITYYEVIGNPQDDREAELEIGEQESDEHESGEQESGEQESGVYESGQQESGVQESGQQESGEHESGVQ